MILLIDLDGTLTNTAHPQFKKMKDGLEETIISSIPLFDGAVEFINYQKNLGNTIIIVSDSHPKYVNKISTEIFNSDFIYLADKPNPERTLEYINSNPELLKLYSERDNFILIGDSFLDIELGRRLNIRTIQTKFYKATEIEERDGIGQDWKPLKMGPTYYVKKYLEINEIIENPFDNLLAIEAAFKGRESSKAVAFKDYKSQNGYTAFRCLARQEDGECDKYARADKYYQIDNPNRSLEFLKTLAFGVDSYLAKVESFPEFQWDYLTYVSDKKTTSPPNKMKEIFDLVNCSIPKIKLFDWRNDVKGSLRNRPDYKSRKEFINKYLFTLEGIDLSGKSIIIIDDQFTSSATAQEITAQLKYKGVKNILFVALFYLILPIQSKLCPRCNNNMKITVRREDGVKFYYCNPKVGCGLSEKIN
jgi:phosphoglycolate phosphatase-like HAD superfamily hydrolase